MTDHEHSSGAFVSHDGTHTIMYPPPERTPLERLIARCRSGYFRRLLKEDAWHGR